MGAGPLVASPPGSRRAVDRGLWLAEQDGATWVVKRLASPDGSNPALLDRAHAGYWRREAEVARHPGVVDGPGLVPAEFGAVEEDDEGLTVWSVEVVGSPPPGLFVARALGRFAAAPYDAPPWASRHLLRTGSRWPRSAAAGPPWPARPSPTSPTACGSGAATGSPGATKVPRARPRGRRADQLRGRARRGRVAVDWQCFGIGPVGRRPRLLRAVEPRGVRGAARDLPARRRADVDSERSPSRRG